ncbi:hypothetical protein DAPPUDRAFT_323853 [Daphnia pulex]|uniref:Uncharacterized protein n=1 Tax=Daphnia pulex TaxID=6669 RepID=E9GZY6_DAPPU|nr:hypothetical protein DAPPUDRAFT_323853 [Daphnia pulex]|eukprot:EFX74901.1 hypothetical protein DAPPUDRAFT_323853 [Daphnia pulex]
MPHIGWLGTRASKQEKTNFTDVYVSQRVVDFNVENTEEKTYDAILKVYRNVSLVAFVAQLADGNSRILHCLPTLNSAELRKFEAGGEFCSKLRCVNCCACIASSTTLFVQHKLQYVRRYQGTDYEESDSDSIEILNDTIPNSSDVHVEEEQFVQLEITGHSISADYDVEEEQNLHRGDMDNVISISHETIRGSNVLVTRDARTLLFRLCK